MRGVEIGDADLSDQSLLPETRDFMQGIEPGGMLEGPPVKLQQIDPLDAKTVKPRLNSGPNDVCRHRTGFRAPFW